MRLAGPLDLPHSLQGGQAFLWRREEDRYRGVVDAKVWTLREHPDGSVEATGATRRAFERYFRIGPEDEARRERLAKDPVLAPAMRTFPGLRLLRQDPWETTVAFLTSANNNVLRIEGILRALVARYGGAIAEHERAFPSAERLARATERELRAAGLGYRAPFLKATARAIAKGDVDLRSLRGAAAEEAREALVALPGIGPKVADCIALFSLDVDDAFPIDRWVLRAADQAFGRSFTPKDLAAFARERWGRDAGLAQQYLFHAIRMEASAPGTRRTLSGTLGDSEG